MFKKVVPIVVDIATDRDLGIDIDNTRENLWDFMVENHRET